MVNIKIVFNEGLKQEWIVSKSAKQLDEFMTALEKNPKIDFLQFGQKLPNKKKLIKSLLGSKKHSVKGKIQDFLQKVLSLK